VTTRFGAEALAGTTGIGGSDGADGSNGPNGPNGAGRADGSGGTAGVAGAGGPGPGGPARDSANGPARDSANSPAGDLASDTDSGPLSDSTMVARARDGDTRAYETLVRRYQQPIYRLAARMLNDSGEAEDVTQEVFVTAWRRLPDIHEDKAIRSWLYRIATNRCLNILRSRKPVAPLYEDAIPVADPAASPEARAEAHERLIALRVALDQLTAEQRACWLLREMEELSYAEIAGILHTTPQAVRGRLARARAELGEAMISWR
jgi:RNA polymerase sigma-70 factor, ECF subfamily